MPRSAYVSGDGQVAHARLSVSGCLFGMCNFYRTMHTPCSISNKSIQPKPINNNILSTINCLSSAINFFTRLEQCLIAKKAPITCKWHAWQGVIGYSATKGYVCYAHTMVLDVYR